MKKLLMLFGLLITAAFARADTITSNLQVGQNPGVIYAQVSSFTFNNSTVLSSVTASTNTTFYGSNVIAVGQLTPGRIIEITAEGNYSTTAAPTLEFQVKVGTFIVNGTGARTVATSLASLPFHMHYILTTYTAGINGSVQSSGSVMVSTAALPAVPYEMMSSSGAVTVDTTIPEPITIGVIWGTASGANTITFTQVVIRYLD